MSDSEITTIGSAGVAMPSGPASSAPVVRTTPSAEGSSSYGLSRYYAVFDVDPLTREVSLTVVDESGQVLRTIPPSTVAEMLASLRRYVRG
jgi:hypothetical protein